MTIKTMTIKTMTIKMMTTRMMTTRMMTIRMMIRMMTIKMMTIKTMTIKMMTTRMMTTMIKKIIRTAAVALSVLLQGKSVNSLHQKNRQSRSHKFIKKSQTNFQIFVEKKGRAVHVRKEHPRFPREVLVEVSYDILCPARLDVNLRTSNGNIEIQDVEAVTQVKTTNGNVQFRGNPGYLEIKTSNGNIRASVIQLRDVAQFETKNGRVAVVVHSGIAPISAVTTNGSIDVTLPADFSGKLEARTVNGRAQSVFDIPRPTGSRQNRLSGTLGSGGDTLVQLRAVNGNVNLWKLQ